MEDASIKNFDCVKFQRDIRNKFFEESDCYVRKLFKLLKEKPLKSDILRKFVKRDRKKNYFKLYFLTPMLRVEKKSLRILVQKPRRIK